LVKSKILFINMPIRENALPNDVPLGPLVLTSYLNRMGYSAEILDLNTHRPRSNHIYDDLHITLLNRLSEGYDVICISGLITTLKYQEIVCKITRILLPNAYIVSGGGLATDIKELLFQWIPELDAICIGPAEESIIEIVNKEKKVYHGKNPDNLDYYYKLDYSLVEVEKYINNPVWGGNAKNSSTTPFIMRRSLNSISSKGCIFDCNFCDREATGGRDYKMRSAISLIKEMKSLRKKYDIDFLGYIDDNATTNTKRLEDMCILYKESGLSLNWGTHARIDDLGGKKGKHKANLLRLTNCLYLGFGGESANKRVLSVMNKGKQIVEGVPQIYDNALQNCKDNGIHPNLTWIMGYPTETLDELKDTLRYILHMEDSKLVEKRYNNKVLFVATAYPNTKLFEMELVQKKIKENFPTLRDYVYQLSDATKFILNYSNIPDDIFHEVKEYINKGELEKVIDL